MSNKSRAKLHKVTVSLKTPFLNIQGEWKADENEQNAAWELYVELVTRISVVKMNPDEGFLREALTSLHQIFTETRQILKKYGPGIAKPKTKGGLSLGYIAVTVLNTVIRPVLSKWHPTLMTYESTRKQDESPFEHEKKWKQNEELRNVLGELQDTIKKYAELLAEGAGISSILNHDKNK